MLLERNPAIGRVPPLVYERKGEMYESFGHGLMFRPTGRHTTFNEWLQERYGRVSQQERPWLTLPFRESPFCHPHYNHGNIADDAGYYLVVNEQCREAGATSVYVTHLFVPISASKADVSRHLVRTLGETSGLYDIRTDVDDTASKIAA